MVIDTDRRDYFSSKRQYFVTCKVSRHCLSALHGRLTLKGILLHPWEQGMGLNCCFEMLHILRYYYTYDM